MSATCPRSSTAPGGFTLLELVVVLALLALATALVAPQGFRMIESWRRATEIDAALGAMNALGAQAQAQGRVLRFERGEVAAGAIPGFPAGWGVEFSAPLVVQANGACGGTRGTLHAGRYTRPFALDAPFCSARLDPDETR